MFKKLFCNTHAAERFWKWFLKHEMYFFQLEKHNEQLLFAQLSRALRKIDEHLTFELSHPLDNGQRELVISADGIRPVFPIVIDLIKKAPTHERWMFTAFRQPAPNPICVKIQDVKLTYDNVKFQYEIIEGALGVRFFIENYDPYNDCYEIGVCMLLDALLGEYDATIQIKYVDIVALSNTTDPDLLLDFPLLKPLIRQRSCN